MPVGLGGEVFAPCGLRALNCVVISTRAENLRVLSLEKHRRSI